jgi:hypothetical protein
MEELQALNFLDYFSVITIGDDKIPNHTWKECQSTKLTQEQFLINLRKTSTKVIFKIIIQLLKFFYLYFYLLFYIFYK